MKTHLLAAAIFVLGIRAQTPDVNYDEAKVPRYTLPDLFALQAGGRVKDAKTWENQRRPEIFKLLETGMFGRSAGKPQKQSFELSSIDQNALGGLAVRKEVTIQVSGKPIHLLLYLPRSAKAPVGVFVGLNFNGNHTVVADPGVRLGETWVLDKERKVTVLRRGEEQSRGRGASQWQVEKILKRGYGLGTVYYGDIEPDFNGEISHGVRPLAFRAGQTAPAADEWGAIAAWGWGLSRVVDYLETDKQVDAQRVALMGHSRLGKAALWAGAMDRRFALVISNDSGEGGAAISRRKFGETVKNLNTRFPHWFCTNYAQYSDREDAMPFDAHMLLSLIAPRPLYVASAEEDQWADPRGEFMAAVAVSPVYELFGRKGIGTDRMPGLHQPVGEFVRYHVRAGKHDVTEYDWEQYLNFADQRLNAKR